MQTGTNQKLYEFNKEFLESLYEAPGDRLVKILAMMVTGVLLGRHVQLWMIAVRLPFPIQLTSIIRQFERFLADERVDAKKYFEPFVWAMHVSLGYEIAYIVLDCTQAGPKCRTLVAGLVYHGTVLPMLWKTYKGNKGHLRGENQKNLLEELLPYLRTHHQVVILGDAEFSNEPVIQWLLDQGWDFVFRFQHRYLVQVAPNNIWQSMKTVYTESGMKAGQVKHWENAIYTKLHHLVDLTLTVHWGENEEEPICLVSTLPADAHPHLVYAMRPWIETLFGNQKSRGFQLARTHLTHPDQIDRLILVLAIATCQVLGLGTHLIISAHTALVDRSDRRDLSLFQIGFRWFLRLLALDRLHDFKMYFRWDFTLPPPGFQPAQ